MIPIWILCHFRTGSSHLCELLNNTGLFSDNLFAHWQGEYKPNMKIDWHCRFLNDIKEKTNIEHKYPDVQYLLLDRSDKISQTVSYYFASTSGIWYLRSQEQRDSYMQLPLGWDDTELLAAYDLVCSWSGAWGSLGFSGCTIYYEELLADPVNVLTAILQYFNLPTIQAENAVKKTLGNERMLHRMTRPNSEKCANRLRELIKARENQ